MNLSAELVALVPVAVVTVTSTSPRDPAGETAVIEVDELTAKLVAATAPKLTPLAPVKFVPVHADARATGRRTGDWAEGADRRGRLVGELVGGARVARCDRRRDGDVAVPAICAGEVAVICVDDTTV